MLSEFASYFKGMSLEELDVLARSFSFGTSTGLGKTRKDDVVSEMKKTANSVRDSMTSCGKIRNGPKRRKITIGLGVPLKNRPDRRGIFWVECNSRPRICFERRMLIIRHLLVMCLR